MSVNISDRKYVIKTLKSWQELSIRFRDPSHRGNGISEQLFTSEFACQKILPFALLSA